MTSDLATINQDGNALMGIISGMLSTGQVDIPAIERMLEMKNQWDAEQARRAYAHDRVEFKVNAPAIVKKRQVSHSGGRYKFANLGDVSDAIETELAKHGFSYRWTTEQTGSVIAVTCVVTHRLGHSETCTRQALPDNSGSKNPIQQDASAQTYLQRYTLLSALGMATEDDDDGQTAYQPPPQRQQQQSNRNPQGSTIQPAKPSPQARVQNALLEKFNCTLEQALTAIDATDWDDGIAMYGSAGKLWGAMEATLSKPVIEVEDTREEREPEFDDGEEKMPWEE